MEDGELDDQDEADQMKQAGPVGHKLGGGDGDEGGDFEVEAQAIGAPEGDGEQEEVQQGDKDVALPGGQGWNGSGFRQRIGHKQS